MSPNFLKKHGFSQNIQEKIHYVKAAQKYHVDGLEIETLRSTDEGVAFYVEMNGVSFFHAGDLNDWQWDGAGEMVNGLMQANYRAQITRLSGKKIHLAFIPMDPRQGQYQFVGIDYFMKHTDSDYIFPMHMWQNYSGIREYKKQITNVAMAERIVEIRCENQIFEIREE